MGGNSAELNLLALSFPNTISDFLKEVSAITDVSEKSSKLNAYLRILEDELRKIHYFQRELPLSVELLNDAIKRLKEETVQCARDFLPVTVDFMQLEGNSGKEKGKTSIDFSDKKNWMSSVQLCSTSDLKCQNNFKKQVSELDLKLRDVTEDDSAICNSGNKGGSFAPFKGGSGFRMREEKGVSQIEGRSLSIELNLEGNSGSTGSCSSSLLSDQLKTKNKLNQPQKPQKKDRRCWSPELHRRFVDALQKLGGAQAATPKHIRELMKIDGLTNDEVKSHLQKYRIHIQKSPASSEGRRGG